MKQPQLNGAYYGPAIPPQPQREFHSVGRRSGCGPCCLLCNLLKLIVSIIIIIGIIVVVVWLVLRPHPLKVHVTSVSLKQFSLSNGSLQYDLSTNMTIRNPNRRVGIYYDYIEATSYYDGSRFGFDNSIRPFYQGHKNTSNISPAFNGTTATALFGDSISSTYKKENSSGYYNIELKVRPKLRLKIWIFKIKHIKPKFNCDLKVPVPGTTGSFSETKCDMKF